MATETWWVVDADFDRNSIGMLLTADSRKETSDHEHGRLTK